ncbi:MAG: hypothetical protein K2H28_04545 [Ruminococcus sp.]|nr:hypothetical protein [Ruminococcus sp.]
MELIELYGKALELVEEVKKFRSQTTEENLSLCILVTDTDNIYAGVTGIRISNGAVTTACSEYNALMSMICDGIVCVKQMMTVSFDDNSVCLPCSDCIDVLCRISEENNQCEVAVSVSESVKVYELDSISGQFTENNKITEIPSEPEFKPTSTFEEVPAFSEEPVSDTFSFEEKFGFDFDDTPAEPVTPVQTLSETKQETVQNTIPEQPVMPQGMNPQFIQPDNIQNYSSQNYQQGYPYPQQPYQQTQGYPYPQQQGYPYPQQNPYTQQGNMNPQFVQPDNVQNYPSQNYQQYGQPVNQGSFPYNPQPYPQNNIPSQPLNNLSPHQPAPYVSHHYMNSTGSVPLGSVPLSGEGKSKFRQRLSKFVGEDNHVSTPVPASRPAEESLSKEELKKMARDKKKMAKVNAEFKKRMKDLGY